MLRRSAVVVFALLALTAPARADDETAAAKADFAAGQKEFAAGDYRAAAGSFEEAYRKKPHHSVLWNAARSWQRAGELVRAANDYARYLREAPAGTKDRDTATTAIGELSAKLGKIALFSSGPTDLAIDDAKADADGLYVTPGEHVVSGKSNGEVVKKTVTVNAGQTLSVTLDPPPPPVVDKPPPPLPPPPRETGFHLPWVVVVIGGALTVGGGAFTVWSGIDTNKQRSDYQTRFENRLATEADLDDGKAAQTRTNIALVATIGVAALTGVAAIFVDWGGPSKSTGWLRPTSNGLIATW